MPDFAVPLITASGTILAAILTGFGAAALKRHWDVQTWERERGERRREELRDALIGYFRCLRGAENAGLTLYREMRFNAKPYREAYRELGVVSKLETLAGCIDLLAMLLGTDAVEPFLGHRLELDVWMRDQVAAAREDRDGRAAPNHLAITAIAERLLREA